MVVRHVVLSSQGALAPKPVIRPVAQPRARTAASRLTYTLPRHAQQPRTAGQPGHADPRAARRTRSGWSGGRRPHARRSSRRRSRRRAHARRRARWRPRSARARLHCADAGRSRGQAVACSWRRQRRALRQPPRGAARAPRQGGQAERSVPYDPLAATLARFNSLAAKSTPESRAFGARSRAYAPRTQAVPAPPPTSMPGTLRPAHPRAAAQAPATAGGCAGPQTAPARPPHRPAGASCARPAWPPPSARRAGWSGARAGAQRALRRTSRYQAGMAHAGVRQAWRMQVRSALA